MFDIIITEHNLKANHKIPTKICVDYLFQMLSLVYDVVPGCCRVVVGHFDNSCCRFKQIIPISPSTYDECICSCVFWDVLGCTILLVPIRTSELLLYSLLPIFLFSPVFSFLTSFFSLPFCFTQPPFSNLHIYTNSFISIF